MAACSTRETTQVVQKHLSEPWALTANYLCKVNHENPEMKQFRDCQVTLALDKPINTNLPYVAKADAQKLDPTPLNRKLIFFTQERSVKTLKDLVTSKTQKYSSNTDSHEHDGGSELYFMESSESGGSEQTMEISGSIYTGHTNTVEMDKYTPTSITGKTATDLHELIKSAFTWLLASETKDKNHQLPA